MKRRFLFLTWLTAGILFQGCYYDNETDLYPQLPAADTTSNCDTTDLTYNTDMKAFFDNKCNNCHMAQFPVLSAYSSTQSYVASTGMQLYLKVMNNDHQNVTLTDCEKLQLRAWINAGASQ